MGRRRYELPASSKELLPPAVLTEARMCEAEIERAIRHGEEAKRRMCELAFYDRLSWLDWYGSLDDEARQQELERLERGPLVPAWKAHSLFAISIAAGVGAGFLPLVVGEHLFGISGEWFHLVSGGLGGVLGPVVWAVLHIGSIYFMERRGYDVWTHELG